MNSFIEQLIIALIIGAITGLAALLWKHYRNKIIAIWDYYKTFKEMGLILFLPDSKFVVLQLFEKMITQAQPDDEMLILGRTLRRIVQEREGEILNGLQKGVHFKLLVLDPQMVELKRIELQTLQLTDPQTIRKDLEISIPYFIDLCKKAKSAGYRGTFEVKVCEYIIFNSLTALTQPDKRQIILDFGFSESRTDKYQQYYECNPNEINHFGNKLYNFYRGLYDQSEFYIGYANKTIERSPKLVTKIVTQMIETILGDYSDGEAIRRNEAANLLSHVPRIFDTIHRDQPPPDPLSVQIELTNKCNTYCKHCLRYKWPEKEEMTTDEVKNILSDLASMRVKTITLSGGEPTTRHDFTEILEFAHQAGLRTGVLSNGLNIPPDLAMSLVQNAAWVRISMDAADPATYPNVRGVRNGFDLVIASIRNIVQAKQQAGSDCRIGICYSLQKANITQAKNFIDLVRREGLITDDHSLVFKFVHGSNGFLCEEQQLNEFYEQILKKEDPTLERLTNLVYLRRFIEKYSSLHDIAEGKPLNKYYHSNQTRCFTPYLFSLVDAFGEVYLCCFLYHDNDPYDDFNKHREKYRLGRLGESSFREIWRGEAYNRLRSSLATIDTEKYQECRECTRHYLHNAFLSRLLLEYDRFSQDASDRDISVFHDVLERYQSKSMWL